MLKKTKQHQLQLLAGRSSHSIQYKHICKHMYSKDFGNTRMCWTAPQDHLVNHYIYNMSDSSFMSPFR